MTPCPQKSETPPAQCPFCGHTAHLPGRCRRTDRYCDCGPACRGCGHPVHRPGECLGRTADGRGPCACSGAPADEEAET